MQEAAEGALKDLQLDYLDLFLMHWPVTGNKGPTLEPPIKETWQVQRPFVLEQARVLQGQLCGLAKPMRGAAICAHACGHLA